MLIKRNGKVIVSILICAAIIVLNSSYIFAAGQANASGTARYRVFSLKNISAEQGEKYLTEVGVGTVSQLPGPNALLITGRAEELVKACAVLELVDADEHFYIKVICPASEAEQIPSNEQIAVEVGNISIGTFSESPLSSIKNKAIIDMSGDSIIAIAASEQLEDIVSAIDRLQVTELAEGSKVKTDIITESDIKREEDAIRRAQLELRKLNSSSEPGVGVDDKTEVLFDRLIESISETGEVKEDKTDVQAFENISHPEVFETTSQQINGSNESSVDLGQTEIISVEKPQPIGQPLVESDNDIDEKPKAEMKSDSATEVSRDLPVRRVKNLYEPKPIIEGNETLELDLPEKLNIIDLLDLVGKYLKLDYMYDETKVRGEVALRLQGPIKIKDLYPLLESVLKFRGFVMSRKGNLVTIVPAGEALDIDPVLIDPNAGNLELGDVVITRIFELHYIDTTSAKNLLDGMKLGANITPIEDAGMLIVTGYAYRMGRIERLLDLLDKPGEPKQFRFRQLKYTSAKTLASKVEELASQLETVSVTITAPSSEGEPAARSVRGRTRARRPSARPSAAAEGEPSVYLDADERTNRILMIGLEEQLNAVEDLIDSLDVEEQDFRTLKLYEIQHVGAEEIVDKLKALGIIGGTQESRSDAGRITRPGPAAAEQR